MTQTITPASAVQFGAAVRREMPRPIKPSEWLRALVRRFPCLVAEHDWDSLYDWDTAEDDPAKKVYLCGWRCLRCGRLVGKRPKT